MKKNHKVDFLLLVVFIITISSIFLALGSMSVIDKFIPQYGFNLSKNTWVFWCWLPIPLLSLFLGFKYKKQGYKCTKNIVVGILVSIHLLIFGSFCLIPNVFSREYKEIYYYEEILGLKLPDDGVLEIRTWDEHYDKDMEEYVEIIAYYAQQDDSNLVNSIKTNENWVTSNEMKSMFKVFVPMSFILDTDTYVSFYNATTNEYNGLPKESGKYEIYVMKYDISNKCLEIANYKIDYVK